MPNSKTPEAVSTKQRNFMGMVYAYKKDKLDLKKLPDGLATKIKEVADGRKKKKGKGKTKGISLKDVQGFAKTKHKNLPEYISEDLYLNETCIVVLTFDEHNFVDNFNFDEIGIKLDDVDLDDETEIDLNKEDEDDLALQNQLEVLKRNGFGAINPDETGKKWMTIKKI